MDQIEQVAREHTDITRRYFLQLCAMGVAAPDVSELCAQDNNAEAHSLLTEAISKLEYLTREENFINFGRGKPPPYELPLEKRREVGLVRETWQLEVLPDPESNAEVEQPLSKKLGTALNWDGLMKIAEKKAVRFLHVMSCTNSQEPCGMGLWEGVPLREVIWLSRPTANVRRIFYYGYHNDDPEQRFQSSLPIGRVLEDPPGELPVILCYKLNNQWLTSKRGGPVRMLVPDAYGNKSVKWLQCIILTNNYQANDTYALWNNDTVSHIKTCARFIHVPKTVKAGQPVPVTGIAQVGMSNLSKVQYWLCRHDQPLPKDDPYFTKAPWQDADILPPPDDWGGGLPDGKLPAIPRQFDTVSGKALRWPIPNTIVHWATLLAVKHPGQYDFRCRTIDANGIAQPMPRPFNKSGHNAIQQVKIVVEK
ncbi:MAG TPA: molybdopterin-dependent oxidoreductase [archaeon]|nr:molybdopterin-dependent oxidoreductase [archaeon]HUU81663.1 molybdopterin-dependent oxidoreductase [Acidobacteriota bacterium]